jgi:hypothetical protein
MYLKKYTYFGSNKMGIRIKSFEPENLDNLTIPGSTVPTLFWALPVGNWDYSQLDEYWSLFTNQEHRENYFYGLFIGKEIDPGYKDRYNDKHLSAEGAKLSSLIPIGSKIKIDSDSPSLLILSAAYPQPGYGLLISSNRKEKKFMNPRDFERLVRRVIYDLEFMGESFIGFFNKYKDLNRKLDYEYSYMKRSEESSEENDDLLSEETIDKLESLYKYIHEKEYSSVINILNSFQEGDNLDFYSNKFFNESDLLEYLYLNALVLNKNINFNLC